LWNVRFLNAWQTREMLETSVRLLRLLSLLLGRRDWSGAELAERLGVTTRTVRNDVERLRVLGYQVRSTTGTAGGYRLVAGAAPPPLLLDDEEAVAVAVGLSAAAAGTVTGIEETSLRALAKLEQTLPARLRRRVDGLRSATISVTGGGPTVDADILTIVAGVAAPGDGTAGGAARRDGRAAAASGRAAGAGRRRRVPVPDGRRLAARPGRVPRQPRRAVHRPRPTRTAHLPAHPGGPLRGGGAPPTVITVGWPG
jgi:biotin operon repressor